MIHHRGDRFLEKFRGTGGGRADLQDQFVGIRPRGRDEAPPARQRRRRGHKTTTATAKTSLTTAHTTTQTTNKKRMFTPAASSQGKVNALQI